MSEPDPSARVCVVAAGGFGVAVATRLAAWHPGIRVVAGDGATVECLPAAEAFVLAAWRPTPLLEDLLDEESFARGVPWLRVAQDGAFVALGPVVIPHVGPCHGCFRRRLRQHAVDADLMQALDDHYRTHPDEGPTGFLPPAASFAAAAVLVLLERLRTAPSSVSGQFRRLNLLTGESHVSRVVGIDACGRCGDDRSRSLEDLERLMARDGAKS
jgi:bacteriocin biosynthesis cyclodehydratase domain-containing protein